jgi:hypothetical protein
MSDTTPNKALRLLGAGPIAALCLGLALIPAGTAAAGLLDPSGSERETTSYRATYDDTLLDVARRFNLGYVEIVAANPDTDPWIPGEGTNVVLPRRTWRWTRTSAPEARRSRCWSMASRRWSK